MNTKTFICIALAGTLASGVFAGDKQSKLEAQAKVSRAEAEKIALAKVPGGKIKDSEIEEEDGRLIWSFDIATAGTKELTEVEVDAKTGEIIKDDEDDSDKEGKEKKGEKDNGDDEKGES